MFVLIFGCAGWVFVTECRLSLVASGRGSSLVAVCRLLTAVASWALGVQASVVVALKLST